MTGNGVCTVEAFRDVQSPETESSTGGLRYKVPCRTFIRSWGIKACPEHEDVGSPEDEIGKIYSASVTIVPDSVTDDAAVYLYPRSVGRLFARIHSWRMRTGDTVQPQLSTSPVLVQLISLHEDPGKLAALHTNYSTFAGGLPWLHSNLTHCCHSAFPWCLPPGRSHGLVCRLSVLHRPLSGWGVTVHFQVQSSVPHLPPSLLSANYTGGPCSSTSPQAKTTTWIISR